MVTTESSTAEHGTPGMPQVRSGVVASLFREGYMFDFFQAVRILESLFPEGKLPGSGIELADEQIRFRPHTGLTFPPTDIRSVEFVEGDPPHALVTATFHGLYGVDSPLPVYFFETIAQQSERAVALRDFLDMFNHRLYALFYRSWRKYRPSLDYAEHDRDAYSARTLCLAGLGTPAAVTEPPIPPMQLAAFAGSLSFARRTAEGLKNIVGWFFEGMHVAIEENIRRWVPIRARPHVGKPATGGCVLGTFSTIGEAVMDRSGKFRVVLGPMSLATYCAFLPRGAHARSLAYLVKLYAPDNLDYDIRLVLPREEVPDLKLGEESLHLGLNTWLGKPAAATTSRVVEYTAQQ